MRKEWREWLESLVGVATLMLAVVSFWTTTRISSIEDYLKSELKSRTSQLDQTSGEAARLRQEIVAEQRTLDNLRTDSSGLISRQIGLQTELGEKRTQLNHLEVVAESARRETAQSREILRRTGEEAAAQYTDLDLARRIFAYEKLVWPIALIALREDRSSNSAPERHIPVGSDFREITQTTTLLSHEMALAPYMERIRTRISAVCPAVLQEEVVRPAIPPEPKLATFQIRKGETQSQVNERFKAEQQGYVDSVVARSSKISEITMSTYKTIEAFEDRARACVCGALADEKIPRERICPK